VGSIHPPPRGADLVDTVRFALAWRRQSPLHAKGDEPWVIAETQEEGVGEQERTRDEFPAKARSSHSNGLPETPQSAWTCATL
jgi:hypothetical protein